ncbi:peptigoglycan-binding protein LysM [Thiocapsa imhoffii]|uniref:Peptigoglycan-binding protein LysM n=2 Tax=Thiocapsa imhoffii TaxID=382777 RepID=A0A9X1B9S3_9GAMM|nr:L,D-transpeptidase family protein [Thiocapsa imhoffii]MBK1645618.1 peptigoglycan-binding protein LysM [Thiocapsa imhoffii]
MLVALIGVSGCASILEGGFNRAEPMRPDRFLLTGSETDVVGAVQVVVARHEDTLADFARRYGLGFDEILAANPDVDPWLPGRGTRVILPTQYVLPNAPREGIVVNLAALRLFYFPTPEDGMQPVVITHPIGIGREGRRTPVGRMRIIEKTEQPTWTPPMSIRRDYAKRGDPLPGVVPPGPDNPLGSHALRLSRPSYLLHGTNKPYGVGMRVSSGCLRLYPEDIERLYEQVPIGTQVNIVNQPYLAGQHGGTVFLQAYPPLSEDAARWQGSLEPLQRAIVRAIGDGASEIDSEIDWDRARDVAEQARAIPVSISPRGPSLEQVIARARRVPPVPPWSVGERGELNPVVEAGAETGLNEESSVTRRWGPPGRRAGS